MAEFVLKVSDHHKSMLLTALDLKIASIKRASNSTREPEFLELYDRSLMEYDALKQLVFALK